MTLEQKEKRLSPQNRRIWKDLRRGMRLNPIDTFQNRVSSKLSTRAGEIERALGITLERGWKRLSHTCRVRTYSYRAVK